MDSNMARKPNIYGGGANTNKYGLEFEQTTDLEDLFNKHQDFDVRGNKLYKQGEEVGLLIGKHALYKDFLEPRGVDYKQHISKKLIPDDALLVNKVLYIVEKKFQRVAGSVDEKLQTCDFKKKQYQKLMKPLGISVEYYYVLNDWFKHPQYDDVRQYITDVGCKYFFNVIPFHELGL